MTRNRSATVARGSQGACYSNGGARHVGGARSGTGDDAAPPDQDSVTGADVASVSADNPLGQKMSPVSLRGGGPGRDPARTLPQLWAEAHSRANQR